MYQHCGFFSYKRGAGSGGEAWYENTSKFIAETVQPQTGLERYPLFFDRGSIPNGSYWENTLHHGLDRSPFLIAFFSPSYFRSTYCMAELRTFIEREDQLNLPRGTLIQTATISDSTYFPDWAKDIQTVSFQKFFVPLPSYWKSPSAADFAIELSKFSMEIAGKINLIKNGGPAHSPDFPKLTPVPVQPKPDVPDIFGPAGTITQPFVPAEAA